MYAEPEAWARLLERLALSAATFLRVQIDAGASAVQLFDSWAGVLSAADYEARVLPYSREVFDGIGSREVPRIHFGVGTGELLPLIGAAGADVVGVDWRIPLDEAARRVGRTARCRATSTPPCCWPTGRPSTARCAGWSSRAAPPAATSSTWATACCPTPIPACSPTSPTWCTS